MPLGSKHPGTWTRVDDEPGKQYVSFASVGSPSFSVLPAGQLPPGVIALGPLQDSKCPVSSEKATLYECAAQMTRVCSDDVLYIGWKSYGMLLQLVPVGSYWTWPNPLAALAVIEPNSCVVRSLMVVTSP